MFSVSFQLITGCMIGIEFLSGADIGDPSLSLGIAVDLAIVRVQFGFYKDRLV